jgi:hypothetical protein
VPSRQGEEIRLLLTVNASNQPGNGVATTASNPISFGCHLIFSRHGWGLDARQDLVVMPLEWFGRTVALRRLDSRSLGDEVGFDVGGWLTSVGVDTKRKGGTLMLRLPSPALQGLRRGKGATAKRLVLDLNGPTFAQRIGLIWPWPYRPPLDSATSSGSWACTLSKKGGF